MQKVYLAVSQKVEVEHTKDDNLLADMRGVAQVIYFLFGQGWVEDLLKPVLTEFGVDHRAFFKAFWNRAEKVALSE